MSVIQWASFGWKRRVPLCATCVWGTVRSGEGAKEMETLCRLTNPTTLVPFPVRNCTDFVDRTVPTTEPKADERRFGFVSVDSIRVRLDETVEVIPLESSVAKTA
jgi:hypothetical protein